ncbi:unnamed protein product [Pelagomonas calceolata]|uniref:MYND-type domain-containing protein n=2 Tax=Pelagomonas calceolata TaxID=35677 RepID=A0A8J2SKM1_9STRA|nr:unnamed protein product [Pelagomonas calceolata]
MRGGVRGPSRSPAAAPGGAPVLRECDVCGTRCVAKRCGRCGRRSYCGVRCQREDWASHRVACGVAPAAACAVCARGGTTTAPPCGHGLCAACEYALSKRRKPGRPKCPRCRAPEQSESALILEDEVPLLRARHAAVVRTDAAEARRLLSRAAERCRAAQAWEAAAARRDAGLEGRRSSRRHAVLADLELGEALLGLGDFDGRPPRVIFCALFWVTTPKRRTRAAQARRRRSVGASRSPRRARRASSRPPPPPFGRASRGRNSKSATPRARRTARRGRRPAPTRPGRRTTLSARRRTASASSAPPPQPTVRRWRKSARTTPNAPPCSLISAGAAARPATSATLSNVSETASRRVPRTAPPPGNWPSRSKPPAIPRPPSPRFGNISSGAPRTSRPRGLSARFFSRAATSSRRGRSSMASRTELRTTSMGSCASGSSTRASATRARPRSAGAARWRSTRRASRRARTLQASDPPLPRDFDTCSPWQYLELGRALERETLIVPTQCPPLGSTDPERSRLRIRVKVHLWYV